MPACIACNEDFVDDDIYVCEKCTQAICRQCSERLINSGTTKCFGSCDVDVVDPMMTFYDPQDEFIKKLAGLKLKSEVDKGVKEGLRDAETARVAQTMQVNDLNDDAVRMAELFQCCMLDTCPKCKAAFVDFEGCVALTCATCYAAFCALCLNEGPCATHGHTSGHLHENAHKERVQMKLLKFVEDHFPKETRGEGKIGRKYRLFQARLEKMDITTSVTDVEALQKKVLVKTFIATSLDQVKARVESERLSVYDVEKRRVKDDCRVPEGYTVELVFNRKEDRFFVQIRLNVEDPVTGRIISISDIKLENVPKTEELSNVRSIYTAVIVGTDGRMYQSIRSATGGGCQLSMVRNGKVGNAWEAPTSNVVVQGICGNRRMIEAEAYIKQLKPDGVCDPVKAIIGAIDNKYMVTELRANLLDGASLLNSYQQKVVDLTRLKASNVIIGPPGTGKSKTIVNLILQILAEFESHHVVVLTSEKNGAVEAVAEHLWNACTTDGKVTDVTFFEKIAAFGSAGMKEKTRSFTLQEKVGIHPELLVSSKIVKEKKQVWANAVSVCKNILKDRELNKIEELEEVLEFISTQTLDRITVADLTGAVEKLDTLVKKGGAHEEVIRMVLSKLRKSDGTRGGYPLAALEAAHDQYRQAMKEDQALLKAAEKRMISSTRVFLATIGSMEKVYSAVKGHVVDAGEDDNEYFGYCQSEDVVHQDLRFHNIIDEASTVPQFEICSLGIIGHVESLHVVGDPNQLQPFSPSGGRPLQQSPTRGLLAFRDDVGRMPGGQNDNKQVTVQSIFKVSTIEPIHLELQYRIPRLIANLLDKNIYRGRYKSHPSVPFNPFPVLLVNVPTEDYVPADRGKNNDRGGRGGRGGRGRGGNKEINPSYVNSAEARMVIEMLRHCEQLKRDDVLVLTPYRQQMYEIKDRLNDAGLKFDINSTVITADQSQGMEADYVIISLTNSRPTKFLDMNRLNVMLSRAKRGVVLLADKKVLDAFCQDSEHKKRLELVSDFLAISTEDVDKENW